MNEKKEKIGLESRQMARRMLAQNIDDEKAKGMNKLSMKDQGLVKAITSIALRHRGEIEYYILQAMDRKPPVKARHLIHTLHVAVAQIMFMEVPDHSAIDLAVSDLASDKRSERFKGLGNAVLRKISKDKEKMMNEDVKWRGKVNCPKWLWQQLRKDYGREKAELIVAAHIVEPPINIMVKDNVKKWVDKFGEESDSEIVFGNCIRIKPCDVTKLEGFKDGEWWVQDAAASLPVELFGEVKGKRIADLCAAPGGKTIQLILKGAKVTAVERDETRIKRLKENLLRMKLKAEIIQQDVMTWKPKELFDGILIDAPCSSTGTIRRHPDVQWKKNEEEVTEMAEYQKNIIDVAIEMVKIGGTIIFANCSLAKEEGENVLAKMLKTKKVENNHIKPKEIFEMKKFINRQGAMRTLPCDDIDGFFAARMVRVK